MNKAFSFCTIDLWHVTANCKVLTGIGTLAVVFIDFADVTDIKIEQVLAEIHYCCNVWLEIKQHCAEQLYIFLSHSMLSCLLQNKFA